MKVYWAGLAPPHMSTAEGTLQAPSFPAPWDKPASKDAQVPVTQAGVQGNQDHRTTPTAV